MSKANKAKKLIPKTAKDCEISEEMTEDIINFYYSELRKKMESLDHNSIGIPVLGTFKVSKPKITKSVKKLTEILSLDKPESFDKIRRFNITTEVRDKQKELLEKIQKEDEDRKQRYKDLGK